MYWQGLIWAANFYSGRIATLTLAFGNSCPASSYRGEEGRPQAGLRHHEGGAVTFHRGEEFFQHSALAPTAEGNRC